MASGKAGKVQCKQSARRAGELIDAGTFVGVYGGWVNVAVGRSKHHFWHVSQDQE